MLENINVVGMLENINCEMERNITNIVYIVYLKTELEEKEIMLSSHKED